MPSSSLPRFPEPDPEKTGCPSPPHGPPRKGRPPGRPAERRPRRPGPQIAARPARLQNRPHSAFFLPSLPGAMQPPLPRRRRQTAATARPKWGSDRQPYPPRSLRPLSLRKSRGHRGAIQRPTRPRSDSPLPAELALCCSKTQLLVRLLNSSSTGPQRHLVLQRALLQSRSRRASSCILSHSASSTAMASRSFALHCAGIPLPQRRHVAHNSSHATLSGRIAVLGHSSVTEPWDAQITLPRRPSPPRQPHRRRSSRPCRRQSSHFHAAAFPVK